MTLTASPLKIALFDMDGVLLESLGYHIALQETVHHSAVELGYPAETLSMEAIAAFEAAGITSEWDEAAICQVVLLRRKAGLGPYPAFPGAGGVAGADFLATARRLAQPDLLSLLPLVRAEKLLIELDPELTPAQRQELGSVLRQAHQPQASPSHRLFQELVLGSAEFSHIYGLPAQRDTDSYLRLHDRSFLDESLRQKLQSWLAQPGCRAAILTSRPCLPPPGVFGTPEAEIGAALVGLSGLPISGWGGLSWLGEQRRLDPQQLLKPNPVHALVALQLALGASYPAALESGLRLGWEGAGGAEWQALDGAEVSVFEDTRGGIRSLLAAQQALAQQSVKINLHLCGIARRPVKISALEAAGAVVYPDLAAALLTLLA